MKQKNKAHICRKCGRELQSTNKSGYCEHCKTERKGKIIKALALPVGVAALVVYNPTLRKGAVKIAKNTLNIVKGAIKK